jgi:oxygen-independent coproporphyrinogen III oxidase
MPVFDHNALGLYFSIPFCRAKCTYCNFASGVFPASDHARYADRLIDDLIASSAWARSMRVDLPRTVDTVYFGGGTPVLLAPELFTRIFSTIRDQFDLTADAEITVECAPGQLSDAMLKAMTEAGVNRVSLGVQSFIDREAQLSGRFHSRSDVLEDIRRLRAAGISNLNLDLLAGLAEQTIRSWRESVAVLLETGVPHASIYMLEIDEDSRLGRELISGGARYSAGLVPGDDAIAQMYEEAVAAFAAAGLAQYEISNFARRNADRSWKSRHNLRYWQRRPYLGLGLDASSMLCAADSEDGSWDEAVLRTTTTSDLSEYLTVPGKAPRTVPETAWLGRTQQLEEAWFLGLRRNAGVAIAALRAEFGVAAIEPAVVVVRRLVEDGLLAIQGDPNSDGIVCLTERGRLISNDVFAEFLGLAPELEHAMIRAVAG